MGLELVLDQLAQHYPADASLTQTTDTWHRQNYRLDTNHKKSKRFARSGVNR